MNRVKEKYSLVETLLLIKLYVLGFDLHIMPLYYTKNYTTGQALVSEVEVLKPQ